MTCAVMPMIGMWRPDCFSRLDGFRRLQPVHLWHLHVHQHQIEIVAVRMSIASLPLLGNGHSMAVILENAYSKPLVDETIFH